MKNCKNLPTEMKIDFIRLYQDKEDPRHTLCCSPEGFPTQKFIEDFSGESLSLSLSLDL
jgi:hypothetical protein